MPTSLSVEYKQKVCLMTLQRPRCLNALDTALRNEVVEAIEATSLNTSIKAIIITGAGGRGFCAGQDLRESAALGRSAGPAWMQSWVRYFSALSSCEIPVIAAVNGVAAGAGFQTALLADIRIATHNASFLMAEANAGLPAIVGSELLAMHLGRSRATELVLTARTLSAVEACEIGLVNQLSDESDLLNTAFALARTLASKPPVALHLNTKRFRAMIRPKLRDAEAAAERYQTEAVASGEPQAVMNEFFEQRSN